MQRKPIRQGDVLFLPIDEIPKGAETITSNVIAEGEVTGHAHRAGRGLRIFEDDGYLFVDGRGPVTHEEHNVVQLLGSYQAIIQREYDDKEEWSEVAD